MKYGIKANLSTKSISELLKKLKIAQCSKRKKGARNAKSCQKVAEIETQEEFKEN